MRVARLFPSVVFCIWQSSFSFAESALAKEPDAMKLYHSTFFVAGELLRASVVCGGDWQRTARVAIDLIASPEMKALQTGFPKLTRQWGEQGANNFNNAVMTSGIPTACAAMKNTQSQAEDILSQRH